MADDYRYRVDIKESAYERNRPIRRLLEFPGGDLSTERSYDSEEAAELDVIRLNELGNKELRLQSAEHDNNPFQAYIVDTGKSAGGYGRTTRNASSGWQKARKTALERDEFSCQECGDVGGVEGEVELQVHHITPQSAGGTDDPENLRTLCRECHMETHEATPRRESAPMSEIARAISDLAEDSDVPAFRRRDLHDSLIEEIGIDVRYKLFNQVVESLTRYDRFAKTVVERVQKVGPELTETYRSEYVVIYDESVIDDSDLLSYEDGLVYDGGALYYGDIPVASLSQSGLTDFIDSRE
ncbi:HNH endonuclease signature motif containing protein [Halorubrum sp. Boch-26]|uniref:HNH endonuclease n=1 Tax=Halorubrum sp. Boch-26 TaxID=2994426 RepID=UPI002468D816|nr:HNH endonuclease signature motif containing protein [Halorubrum sp. Boch-26]